MTHARRNAILGRVRFSEVTVKLKMTISNFETYQGCGSFDAMCPERNMDCLGVIGRPSVRARSSGVTIALSSTLSLGTTRGSRRGCFFRSCVVPGHNNANAW